MIRLTLIGTMLLLLNACNLSASSQPVVLDGEHRSAGSSARDAYRNPAETLAFFGIRPDMHVVEIWPGPNGWYTEILAPMLRENGKLYAAHFPPDSGIPFFSRALAQYQEKLATHPDVYDRVELTYLLPPAHDSIAPEESVDAVLTFRNVHNWTKAGNDSAVFAAMYKALKPGGILGVVEHRAYPGLALDEQIRTGYMTEAYVIQLAEQAGFSLEARSEVNANPRDSKDHPAGVWSLPPTLRQGDVERDYYLGIGESDRMTLKFIKPGSN